MKQSLLAPCIILFLVFLPISTIGSFQGDLDLKYTIININHMIMLGTKKDEVVEAQLKDLLDSVDKGKN